MCFCVLISFFCCCLGPLVESNLSEDAFCELVVRQNGHVEDAQDFVFRTVEERGHVLKTKLSQEWFALLCRSMTAKKILQLLVCTRQCSSGLRDQNQVNPSRLFCYPGLQPLRSGHLVGRAFLVLWMLRNPGSSGRLGSVKDFEWHCPHNY